MSKFVTSAALFAAALAVSSCGTSAGSSALSTLLNGSTSTSTSASSGAQGTTSLLGNLLGNFLSGSSELTQDALIGTWKYQQPDCVFESENLLMKAGGAVAANKVEAELSTALAKVGIKSGSCSFTFNKDNTYTAVIGNRKITGNYTLNAKDKTITMTYLAGLGTMTPKATLTNGKLCLLYESDKLLKLVSAVSALSGSTAVKTLGTIAGEYDGMYIGMQLKK